MLECLKNHTGAFLSTAHDTRLQTMKQTAWHKNFRLRVWPLTTVNFSPFSQDHCSMWSNRTVQRWEREREGGGEGSSSANRCSGFTNHATADTKSSHDLRRTTPHTNHLNGRPTAVTGPSHGPASQPTEVINNQRAVSSGGLPGRSTADLLLGGLTSLVNHQSAWGSTALCGAMEAGSYGGVYARCK